MLIYQLYIQGSIPIINFLTTKRISFCVQCYRKSSSIKRMSPRTVDKIRSCKMKKGNVLKISCEKVRPRPKEEVVNH
jgi:hypothetical protein